MLTRKEVDRMNYEELLRLVRFEPLGSEIFTSDIGGYIMDRFDMLRDTLPLAEKVAASKHIGWGD